jgi:hypothetical protein
MKLVLFISISVFLLSLVAPELVVAQEPTPAGNTSSTMNGQATLQSPGGSSQHVADAASNISPIELSALYGRSNLMTDQDIKGNNKQADRPAPSVIEKWRERVFNTLSAYFGSHQQVLMNDSWFWGNNNYEPGSQVNDGRIATKLVMKETLKFARENIPEINTLVNALKVEIASDRSMREDSKAEVEAGDRKADNKSGKARADKGSPAAEDKIVFKTGLRVRVDSGKLGLASETEARYGKASYFYKVNLDNQGENSLGVRYVLDKTASLQIERDFSHTMNPATRNRPSVNVIQLGFRF